MRAGYQKKQPNIIFFLTFFSTIISLISLIFIMLSIPLQKEQIFIHRDTFSNIEIAILFGFLFIFLFHIFSLVWIFSETRKLKPFNVGKWLLFVFGSFSLFLFLGEKIMLDEIGHEYLSDWSITGEWVILYLLFIIQLIYNSIILFRLRE